MSDAENAAPGPDRAKAAWKRAATFIATLADKRAEQIILLLALLHGLLYLTLVPPWQHYDEPTHFEYAWLIAARGTLPQPGDYDPQMRREVAASMVEHSFFYDLGFRPNLLLEDEPIWIGISELQHPPFYYLLAALPLRLIRHADVTAQLYAARAVSLLLFLLTVWLAGRIVADLLGPRHPLRWAVPALMALLPAYADLMTAVNSDVGAVAVFTLFLWGAVRIIRRGVSWPRLAWVAGAAALCLWTKNTVSVAVLLAPLAVLLALSRGRWPRPVWAGLVVLGLASIVAVVGWGDAAFWYRLTDQAGATRETTTEAPLGQAVLAVEARADRPGWVLSQPLLEADVQALRGQTVTLGAWIWASEPVQMRSPMLDDGLQVTWEPVEVGQAPAFHAMTATLAAEAKQVKVILQPLPEDMQGRPLTVYYDGLILVEGAHPLVRPPLFADPAGRGASWGGETVANRLRNGSAEAAWPRVRSWIQNAISGRLRVPFHPSALLGSILDWRRTNWVYTEAVHMLVRSSWAVFGWGHVRLTLRWYRALEVLAAIGAGSALFFGIRRWRDLPSSTRRALALCLVAAAWIWAAAVLRVHPSLLDTARPRMPVARYAFPAIVPVSLFLTWGWYRLAPRRGQRVFVVATFLFLLVLDVLSLFTIVTFYSQR